jgi:predicted thioredoxin/glutaredoxin
MPISMSITSWLYLAEMLWPFLAAAAAVGLVTGWLSIKSGRR